MKVTAVSQLKASLSEFLRRVKAGEEVIVTERGRPIARLVPVDAPTHVPEHTRELERQGRIRIGSGRLPPDLWRAPRPKDPRALVRRALSEDRESSR